MLYYSYPWPEILSCDKFDWHTERDPNNPASQGKLCAGNPRYTKEVFAAEFPEVMNGTYNPYTIDTVSSVSLFTILAYCPDNSYHYNYENLFFFIMDGTSMT